LLREKLALIYEYNEDSPLFLRAAEYQLEKSNPEKAIQIITEGIKKFPLYPTAYLALGKVLLLIRNYDGAEKAFIKGSNLINDHQTLGYYLNELEKQRAVEGYFAKSRRTSFLSDELSEILDGETEKPALHKNIIPAKIEIDETSESFENKLDDLAKQISTAKINVPLDSLQDLNVEKNVEEISEEGNIQHDYVSETIAKIYLSQGKFREAVETYKKLIIRYPERKNEFENIIREIREQVNDSGW
jgi:tetratricopeptide (TPR) repeat protein